MSVSRIPASRPLRVGEKLQMRLCVMPCCTGGAVCVCLSWAQVLTDWPSSLKRTAK